MRRRALPLLLLACAVSGCASLTSALSDSPSEAAVEVPKSTPEQSYNAGVLDHVRGDDDAARRDWNRCVAMSSPESDSRVDCLVALEKLASPASLEP
jgi:hypothetical protein